MDNTQPQPIPATEWQQLLGTMLGAALVASIDVFSKWLDSYEPPHPPSPPRPRERRAPPPPQSAKTAMPPSCLFLTADLFSAAALLGVRLDSRPDEIRRAMRFKMIATGAHPDHGGHSSEAERLIAARDLLLEYTKVRDFNAHAGGAP
jgi:hypothetical protein